MYEIIATARVFLKTLTYDYVTRNVHKLLLMAAAILLWKHLFFCFAFLMKLLRNAIKITFAAQL